jgi:hypothetical protein
MTIPLFVFSSLSTGFTTTRSPSGLRFMAALLMALGWPLGQKRLALLGREC